MRHCMIDGNKGIYIPQYFVNNFDLTEWHLDKLQDEIIDCAAGPDNEHYWDSWQTICDAAYYDHEDGTRYYLMQDDDLFIDDYQDDDYKEDCVSCLE